MKLGWAAREGRFGQRGAALVEAALVLPLLLLIVFGIIEYGLLFKDALSVSNAVRAGARVGSSAGTDPLADYAILKGIAGERAALGAIESIVVYKASGPGGQPSSACKSGSSGVSGSCNVYEEDDLAITEAQFLSPAFSDKGSWPSSSRQTSQSASGGPDYLGVYIRVRHNSATGLVLDDRNVEDHVVMRLEPTF